MLARLFLVRHGEVLNPDHICYGDLPGFRLSRNGIRQARAAADHLARVGADRIICSPLRRARETARVIGRRLGLTPLVDERLTEWRLGTRWAGNVWEQLPTVFPGELEAYLDHPDDLPFSPESIAAVADRVEATVDDLGRLCPGKQAILVSHQDPVQAARLRLTGGSLGDLHRGKPGHGAVFTLVPGAPWRLAEAWEPPGSVGLFPPVGEPGPTG